jgi:hypothetical protein
MEIITTTKKYDPGPWPYLLFKLARKAIPKTNTLAYFSTPVSDEEKKDIFIRLTPSF